LPKANELSLNSRDDPKQVASRPLLTKSGHPLSVLFDCGLFSGNSARAVDPEGQTVMHVSGNIVKKLFVGNLGSEATHEELRRLFEAYGQVVQVHIIVDRDTGLPRGFAFVEMTNDAEAEKAIQALNGSILRDRTLDVSYARPRPERPAA
jgi:RNA recognition motif-containing protein